MDAFLYNKLIPRGKNIVVPIENKSKTWVKARLLFVMDNPNTLCDKSYSINKKLYPIFTVH